MRVKGLTDKISVNSARVLFAKHAYKEEAVLYLLFYDVYSYSSAVECG
jgi:hypothetical protein